MRMLRTKTLIRRCTHRGQLLTAMKDQAFDFEVMADAGWVQITHVGNENLYFDFTDDAGDIQQGFCKCL